jgi:hypothetical protein
LYDTRQCRLADASLRLDLPSHKGARFHADEIATMKPTNDSHDNDIHKGAVEDDQLKQEHNTSMRGQLGHRKKGEMIDGNDTDYPEPGESPEHT